MGIWLRVLGLGFWDLGFGPGFRVSVFWFSVLGLGFWDLAWGLGLRVLGFR